MIVVEIGCGAFPGPLLEGADKQFIVDSDEERLAVAASHDEQLTPVHGDARNMDFLPDASVDVILARNVFGDKILREDQSVRERLEASYLSLVRAMKLDVADQLMNKIVIGSSNRKVAILQEASRVLVAHGKLIAVESQSTWIAGKFFETSASDPAAIGGLIVRKTRLSEVAAASYVSRHLGMATWVATRESSDATRQELRLVA